MDIFAGVIILALGWFTLTQVLGFINDIKERKAKKKAKKNVSNNENGEDNNYNEN